MGEAKRRGTYEERKLLAVAKKEKETLERISEKHSHPPQALELIAIAGALSAAGIRTVRSQ